MGSLRYFEADEIIKVAGMIVAPCFIDVYIHNDRTALIPLPVLDPNSAEFIVDITSIIICLVFVFAVVWEVRRQVAGRKPHLYRRRTITVTKKLKNVSTCGKN